MNYLFRLPGWGLASLPATVFWASTLAGAPAVAQEFDQLHERPPLSAATVNKRGQNPAKPAKNVSPEAATSSKDNGGEDPPAKPSAMTAELFFQVLTAELSIQSDPTKSFNTFMEAARKSGDARLYRRALEVAATNRLAEPALTAARGWVEVAPNSRDARLALLQLLLSTNRVTETTTTLKSELIKLPANDRANFMQEVVPRLYARVKDQKAALSVVEQVFIPWTLQDAHPTAAAAWVGIGRMRQLLQDSTGAVDAAGKALHLDSKSEAAARLALESMSPNEPLAEPLVRRYLEAKPNNATDLHIEFARLLIQNKRFAEATKELHTLTAAQPKLADPWLWLGTLQMQNDQDALAERSLNKYVELAEKPVANASIKPKDDTDEDADAPQTPAASTQRPQSRLLAQAYILLAQLSEKRKDYAAAENWLNRVTNPQDKTAAQIRRASVLAQTGKMDEARALIRAIPESKDVEARDKLLAELQLLRENKRFEEAYTLLDQVISTPAFKDDVDLIYEQAMVAEKMNRFDDSERLLRHAIEVKPDYFHAFNALGYSLAERSLRLPEAKALIQKALKLSPDDPYITDSLGWVEFRMGNAKEAISILEGAYKAKPDPEIAAHLGEVLWMSGQKDRAMTVWKEAHKISPSNEILSETLKRLQVKL